MPSYGKPCIQKGKLQRGYSRSGQPQMRVTPAVEIIRGDIHAPGIADAVVYDHYLPVVAVTERQQKTQQRELGIGEIDHLHTCLPHGAEIAVRYRHVGDVLVDEPHFDTLPRFLHQHLTNLA